MRQASSGVPGGWERLFPALVLRRGCMPMAHRLLPSLLNALSEAGHQKVVTRKFGYEELQRDPWIRVMDELRVHKTCPPMSGDEGPRAVVSRAVLLFPSTPIEEKSKINNAATSMRYFGIRSPAPATPPNPSDGAMRYPEWVTQQEGWKDILAPGAYFAKRTALLPSRAGHAPEGQFPLRRQGERRSSYPREVGQRHRPLQGVWPHHR
jgi:hypothetical protein